MIIMVNPLSGKESFITFINYTSFDPSIRDYCNHFYNQIALQFDHVILILFPCDEKRFRNRMNDNH